MYDNYRKQEYVRNCFLQIVFLEKNNSFWDFKWFAPSYTIRKLQNWELDLCLKTLMSLDPPYHLDFWLPTERGSDNSSGPVQLCVSLVGNTTWISHLMGRKMGRLRSFLQKQFVSIACLLTGVGAYNVSSSTIKGIYKESIHIYFFFSLYIWVENKKKDEKGISDLQPSLK